MVKERTKRRVISRIIIDVILFLSKQNLSFRGHYEDLRLKVAIVKTLIHKTRYLSWNCEAIAEYNPVMNEHLSDIQVSKKRMSFGRLQTAKDERFARVVFLLPSRSQAQHLLIYVHFLLLSSLEVAVIEAWAQRTWQWQHAQTP